MGDIKDIIRKVIREDFINELSKNDVHVKEIMKFYDKGTYSTKKAVSIFVSGKTNATRNQILDDLADMGYNDAWEVMDHFKLKIESVTKSINELTQKEQRIKDGKPGNTYYVYYKGQFAVDYDMFGMSGVDRFYREKFKVRKVKGSSFNPDFIIITKIDYDRSPNHYAKLKPYVDKFWDKLQSESVNETTLNEGFGDSIKKIKNLAIKMATTKYDRAKSHLNIDKIASTEEFNGTDAMNKATAALLQQNDLDEDLKAAINKIAVKLGTGATMMGIITALVSMSGWIQYLDSSFTKWYYTEIQKLAEPEVMKVMQDLGRAGQAEGSIYGKIGMYAFFIFFTIAVISLVAARMTKGTKKEYVDKKGVERVAAALPQTEEEPIKECKTCNSK